MQEKASETRFRGCGAYFCYREVLLRVYLTHFETGAEAEQTKNVPYSLQILQFHDAIAKPDDQINADFDFWTAAVTSNLKDIFSKYSKAYHH